jgi:hypothetical protein
MICTKFKRKHFIKSNVNVNYHDRCIQIGTQWQKKWPHAKCSTFVWKRNYISSVTFLPKLFYFVCIRRFKGFITVLQWRVWLHSIGTSIVVMHCYLYFHIFWYSLLSRSLLFGYYYYYYILSQVFFLPWYFSSWASGEPHHSGFKSQLSLWCVMFLLWQFL